MIQRVLQIRTVGWGKVVVCGQSISVEVQLCYLNGDQRYMRPTLSNTE